jgi:SAM-dependent methyltransferase
VKNQYSTTWFELFLQPIQPVQTEREIAFVARWLPQPAYATVLDLCCGQGRHARALAARGYRVTGVDRSVEALDAASKQSSAEIVYLQQDMRNLADLPGMFDAVVNLWQSFGYFDEATNIGILKQINCKLNPGGRLILDIYHRGFFEQHQGVRGFERDNLAITETKRMVGSRLIVQLDYGPNIEADIFEWQLYMPDEMRELTERCEFTCLIVCAGFDETMPASADNPRMQMVLEKI